MQVDNTNPLSVLVVKPGSAGGEAKVAPYTPGGKGNDDALLENEPMSSHGSRRRTPAGAVSRVGRLTLGRQQTQLAPSLADAIEDDSKPANLGATLVQPGDQTLGRNATSIYADLAASDSAAVLGAADPRMFEHAEGS